MKKSRKLKSCVKEMNLGEWPKDQEMLVLARHHPVQSQQPCGRNGLPDFTNDEKEKELTRHNIANESGLKSEPRSAWF